MQKYIGFLITLLGLMLVQQLSLQAQTITVTPANSTIVEGGTQQFSASVIGLSNTAVNWYAGGVAGGDAQSGTISASGLYTAPTKLPYPNPVQILAKSRSESSVSGYTYVTVKAPPPTYALTVASGKVSGNYAAASVVSITANAPPKGMVFTKWTGCTVANPTSASTTLNMPAAATTVTANYAAATYALTVASGTGSGSYAAGTVVTITANAPPNGDKFLDWTGATVANSTASTTTITMPAAATTVTANYTAATYALTVASGTGSGSYAAGTVVTITANAPPAGDVFADWTGATVANSTASTTTITMPAAATTVTANYTAATYALTVASGTGSGSYAAGTVVTITANAPPAGDVFADWTGATVANSTASTTTITMPAAATTVTANYTAATYALTVASGTGSGSYAAGTVVTITANAPPAGEVFADWTGATVANSTASSTTITMPAAATTVTANYTAITYALTVASGTGSGSYAKGTVVTITANAPPAGEVFADWTGATVANSTASTTTITMPAAATTVTANYTAITYALTVASGTGSGSYAKGTVVTITANAPPNGDKFLDWTGATVANSTASTTTITMPAAATTVTANYTAITYALTVASGMGSGNYAAGTVVNIAANAPPAGEAFTDWTGATVANSSASSTTITMPAAATTVTANYADPPATYALTVSSGTGSGSYAAGTVVTITANAPPAGDVFEDWTGATVANSAASSTTITMPAAATTVTANYTPSTTTYALTVINGTGSGNYAAGAVVTITASAPSAGQQFVEWIDYPVGNATAASTTLIMPAAAIYVTANFSAPGAGTIPFPVASHPRLWVTQEDLPRLQSWASSTNPIYQSVLLPMVQAAYSQYTTQYFPGGSPNPTWPEPGDINGYNGVTEDVAVVLAFDSMIDPIASNRIQYAQAARNLLMYELNQAALGHLSGAPFRDPEFITYNRASANGQDFGLIVDWIYNAVDGNGNPILTAADKSTIQQVYMMWANDCLNAEVTGGDSPQPAGITNSPQLLPNNAAYRMAANNYYINHAKVMATMALSIDPSDDPPLNSALPASTLGNTLRSYIADVTGAWLYQQYAMFGDPATVASAYGIPGGGAGLGLTSGGLAAEGTMYGCHYEDLLGELLALQTAGFNNPAYSGPQIGLIDAPMWNRFTQGILSEITPAAQTLASESWLGPTYEFSAYGDVNRIWVDYSQAGQFAMLELLEQETGSTNNVNAAKWWMTNVPAGTSQNLLSNIVGNWGGMQYFLVLDPTQPTAMDPRPNYPTYFFDAPAGRILAHSDWTPSGAIFNYRASWASIYHQNDDAGQFEFYRNGEWLTKGTDAYDWTCTATTSPYHNTMGLQNWCPEGTPSNLGWYEGPEWADGSQFFLGANAGDPTTTSSSGSGYVYAASDVTNLYNRPAYIWDPNSGAMDITQATRSILWLNNDYIVVYDRAASIHPGLFKTFNLSLVNTPTVVGNVAAETMADGQQLFIQTLLPLSPTFSDSLLSNDLPPGVLADQEPTTNVLTVQDASLPTNTRFLHVLQGANPGAAMAQAAYVTSTSGTPFDGAAFAASVVYFPTSTTSSLVATTLPAPATATTMYIAGLYGTYQYGVSVAKTANGFVVTLTPNGTGYTTDSAGLLTVPL